MVVVSPGGCDRVMTPIVAPYAPDRIDVCGIRAGERVGHPCGPAASSHRIFRPTRVCLCAVATLVSYRRWDAEFDYTGRGNRSEASTGGHTTRVAARTGRVVLLQRPRPGGRHGHRGAGQCRLRSSSDGERSVCSLCVVVDPPASVRWTLGIRNSARSSRGWIDRTEPSPDIPGTETPPTGASCCPWLSS